MIYTIGHAERYNKWLEQCKEEERPLEKRGRNDEYAGGSVWPTAEEAWKHIKNESPRLDEYSVYEVDANFEKDTVPSKNGNWNDLLVTSVITREVAWKSLKKSS